MIFICHLSVLKVWRLTDQPIIENHNQSSSVLILAVDCDTCYAFSIVVMFPEYN